jgi:hypothetical protein
MALVRQEIRLNTIEQLEEYALEAPEVARRLVLEDEDRAALLPGLLRLAAAKQVTLQEATAAGVLLGGPNHG